MGLEAVDLLMKLLEGKSVPAVERHIQTDVLLVTRDSVRMPQRGF
jgi:DNA-binding LacI/PurR family transcriptional regulator